jgi:signal transduction histidine kinase
VVEFRDHGCGIPADHLDKIFAPFFSNKANGTGLGLSIVYKIVEQHGGTIEVENASDGGAIFRMRLPLPQPAGGDREGTWTT